MKIKCLTAVSLSLISIFVLIATSSANTKLPQLVEYLRENCYKNSKFTKDNHPCVGRKTCPTYFYSTACFHETCAGESSWARCPILFFYDNSSVSLQCDNNGIWVKNITSQWSACTKLPDEVAEEIADKLSESLEKNEDDKLYKDRIYVIFSWISFSFMVPSLFIMFYFIDRKNTRFNLHKNLILSFLFRVVTFFVHYYGALSKVYCNIFWVLNRYFAVAEVTWMLNEALFLLKLLFRTFDAKSYFWCFFAFGWGFPAFLVFLIYVPVTVSKISNKQEDVCWISYKDTYLMFILYGPMILMLSTNFLTLIFVIRILLQKLRSSATSELLLLKKGIKAALVLMPLLGVIYLFIFCIPRNPPNWYDYLIRVLYPMQGTLACLCYVVFNGEVLQAMRSKWKRWQTKSEFMDRTREVVATIAESKPVAENEVQNDKKMAGVKTKVVHLHLTGKYPENGYASSSETQSTGTSTDEQRKLLGNYKLKADKVLK